MKRVEDKIRKIRSDKRYDIDCVVDPKVYDLVTRLAYICEKPIKDICEMLCINGLTERVIVDNVGRYFRREYEFRIGVYLFGDLNREKYRKPNNATARLKFNVLKDVSEKVDELAFALDSSVRASAGLLITKTVFYHPVVTKIVAAHSPRDEKRKEKWRLFAKTVFGKELVLASR